MDVVFGVHQFFSWLLFCLVLDLFLEQHDSPAKPISLCDAVEEEIQEALEKMPEEDLGWQSMNQWLYRSVCGSHVDVCWSERRK